IQADDDRALPDDVEHLAPLCAPSDAATRGVALPPVDASSVAVFLLSGGTTGLPKLIARTHDDYVCNVLLTSATAGVDA
ncbi:hypothetical protein ACSTHF_22825, partial [Vibrio parahaemolyticus]